VVNEEAGASHAYSFQFLSIVSDGAGILTVIANEPPYI
jgi:hypothetical protein